MDNTREMDETGTAGAMRALSTSSAMLRSNTTSGRAVAVILKPLIDLHGEPRNWRTAAPLYIEALADIPPELLAVAVKHAITSNPYFPKPAELRLSIVDELSDYRRRQDDARNAALMLPVVEVPPPSEADIEAVDGLVAEALRAIAEKGEAFIGAPRRSWEPTAEEMRAGRIALGLEDGADLNHQRTAE
jgi:hypothetical protein